VVIDDGNSNHGLTPNVIFPEFRGKRWAAA
jgi:hypothetical protein